MNAQSRTESSTVTGRLDALGRLVDADPPLAALHERAGGRAGGTLAIPQIASLARLARRLGIVISRAVVAADGEQDLDLWVRAVPSGDEILLEIGGWNPRPALPPAEGSPAERQADFDRAAGDWTWETDEGLRITSLSSAASAILGEPAPALLGQQLTRLFHFREDADGVLPILAALAEQKGFDGQLAELRPGGLYRLSGVPLIDGTGRFAGFRGAATSLPSWLAEPEESAAGDTIDAAAFGERLDRALRDPLDRIIANAETISAQEDGPLRRDYSVYARDIAAAARHLLAMVDDLVDLQAIERPDFRPEAEAVELGDLARRAAGLLSVRAAERNVSVTLPEGDDEIVAVGDFRRVLQILVNLIGNAVRYSPEGGEVRIGIAAEGGFARAAIIDEGRGVAPEDQERIFAKFERVDPGEPGGSGLGLYIARRLARAMGGEVTLRSEPGGGAEFELSLPIAGEPPAAKRKRKPR